MAFTVALIGPDGAGKTSVCRRLREQCPLPIEYLYMGVNRESSNRMLPTTRLIRWLRRIGGSARDDRGPRDPNAPLDTERPRGLLRRCSRSLRSAAGLANRLCEEWYRQCLAWYYQWRGRVVLFDRHFYSDYYAYDIASNGRPRPLARRIHGYMLDRLYPKPHLLVYLDAPADVLLARKGEGTLEILEQRRRDYMQLRERVDRFAVVDASRPLDEVTRDVVRQIVDFDRSRNAEPGNTPHESCTTQ